MFIAKAAPLSGRYLFPFHVKRKEVLFCVAVEKENHRSFLFFQWALSKTRFQETFVPALERSVLEALQLVAVVQKA